MVIALVRLFLASPSMHDDRSANAFPSQVRRTRYPIKPSIAQLEERGTVIWNLSLVLSQGRWFDPGSKDALFAYCFHVSLAIIHWAGGIVSATTTMRIRDSTQSWPTKMFYPQYPVVK